MPSISSSGREGEAGGPFVSEGYIHIVIKQSFEVYNAIQTVFFSVWRVMVSIPEHDAKGSVGNSARRP
jgi:hypothetical protein